MRKKTSTGAAAPIKVNGVGTCGGAVVKGPKRVKGASMGNMRLRKMMMKCRRMRIIRRIRWYIKGACVVRAKVTLYKNALATPTSKPAKTSHLKWTGSKRWKISAQFSVKLWPRLPNSSKKVLWSREAKIRNQYGRPPLKGVSWSSRISTMNLSMNSY